MFISLKNTQFPHLGTPNLATLLFQAVYNKSNRFSWPRLILLLNLEVVVQSQKIFFDLLNHFFCLFHVFLVYGIFGTPRYVTLPELPPFSCLLTMPEK